MGKSEKVSRVKKDKINALRKKFDDFLEDDKKRRDRNVYILERLEKMRSCVATLRINQKGIAASDNNSITENPIYVSNSSIPNNDRIVMRRDLMNYRGSELDDTSVLKEISKKYILIPKIHSTSPIYPVMDLENNNDSDWKSKYNILEQLKRSEKEEPPERDVPFYAIQPESKVLDNKHNASKLTNNSINETVTTSTPLDTEIVNENNLNINPDRENIPYHILSTKKEIPFSDKINQEPIIIQTTNPPINKSKCEITQIQVDENTEKATRENTEIENILAPDKQKDNPNKNTINNFKSDIKDFNQQDNKVEELKFENNNQDNQKLIVEKVISNVVESKTNEEADTNNFNISYVDNKEIEETQELTTKQDQSKANEEQINELETEQREMMYSKDSNEIVEDIQGYEDPGAYAADNNYTNDQYNYYEESKLQQAQDQPYGTVIDEHQESNANYDQNYEQQYVNSYENEYNAQYENQQYENYETHNNDHVENSNFEYQQPEQVNTEYVNSENYILSEPTSETNMKISNNLESYESQENGGDMAPQQEIMQHEMNDQQYDYVEQSHDESQDQLNVQDGYVESQQNMENGYTAEDHTTIQHEMHDMQNVYVTQNQNEIQQQLNVEEDYTDNQENDVDGHIPENDTTIQNEIHDMQQDYVAQGDNEIPQQINVEDNYVENQENK